MTGSNGKTTTKELIASIMNCYLGKGKVLVSKDNYNNDIGMPLTLLNLNKNHKYVILELGMNHVKEIDMLTRIAPPDVALITNIGEAHIENFKSKLDIAGAKKEIFNNVKLDGVAILPKDDEYYDYLSKLDNRLKIISFGRKKNATVFCDEIDSLLLKVFLPSGSFTVNRRLLGKKNILNILAAISCSEALNVPHKYIQKGIFKVNMVPGRLELLEGIRGSNIINDSYNSNPSSAKEAIDVLNAVKQKKILVFGDMAELGKDNLIFHKEIAKYIMNTQINLILGVGDLTKSLILKLGKKGIWFSSKSLLTEELLRRIDNKTTILVKGSRFMEMNKIVNDIAR